MRLNSEMLEVTPDSEDRKQQVIKMATDCVINLRNICYNLTPAELATHADGDNSKIELVSIIQTLVTQFIERTHVPCSIQIDESFTFPIFEKEISQNLFRIIQEALTNIEKHSYATKCSIFIRSKDDGKFMVIYISDDGIGCDIQSVKRKAKRNHFGLKNMMDRAKMIGAEFEIESTPGEGMETRIILPVKAN
ncbi:MAG: ATP-binding protein [Treponema sp.]|nr:ATP-binding protein [Treponema sp.]